MNYKKKTNKRRLWRKFGVGDKKLLHEWSKHLHKAWKLDQIVKKAEFIRDKNI